MDINSNSFYLVKINQDLVLQSSIFDKAKNSFFSVYELIEANEYQLNTNDYIVDIEVYKNNDDDLQISWIISYLC